MDDKPCLHCYLWDALNRYCQDAGEMHHDGHPIYDEIEILRAVCCFTAEFIAANPDPKSRRNRIAALMSGIESQVEDRVSSGAHPKPRKILHQ